VIAVVEMEGAGMGGIIEAEQKVQMDEMFRSHVQRCLQDVWECSELVTDADGDYPYRDGTAACWVSVRTGPKPGVRVFAYAAVEVKRTARLLTEVNELNSRSRWARIFWESGTVMVAADIPWTAVDRPTLAHYTQTVGSVADDIGKMLAVVYGGSTPFPAETDEETQPAGDEEDAA
jgi:hypothetical protein